MLRNYSPSLALLPLLLTARPALAVTAKEKPETCKVGADEQKLDGAKRTAFIKKCMGKGNYEPPARKELEKKTTSRRSRSRSRAAAPVAAPAAAAAAAPPPPRRKQ